MLVASIGCYSQNVDLPYKIKPSGDKKFKVVTTEDSLYERLRLVTNNQVLNVSGIRKEDRKGKYWLWTCYYKNEDIAFVREQIRLILK